MDLAVLFCLQSQNIHNSQCNAVYLRTFVNFVKALVVFVFKN
jgi:hypothetical protein